MSGLKENMSGGIFVMKSEFLEILEDYLNDESFKLAGVQDYKVTEFSAHYFNENPKEWFNKQSIVEGKGLICNKLLYVK